MISLELLLIRIHDGVSYDVVRCLFLSWWLFFQHLFEEVSGVLEQSFVYVVIEVAEDVFYFVELWFGG